MITWEQNEAIVLITAVFEEKTIKFRLEDAIIKHITNHTPKVFYFTLNVENQTYQEIINFEDLKPVVNKQVKLSVKIQNTKTVVQKQSLSEGYYSIARGESFMERYLGMEGWQGQEYKYAVKIIDQNKIEEEIEQKLLEETESKNKTTSAQVQSANLSTKCPKCGSEIDKNLDICPICLSMLIETEKDVDIAL